MRKKLLKLLDRWPKAYISSGDIGSLIDGSKNALHSLLKRSIKEGILIRLKRDFYLIGRKIQETKPNPFEIAGLLYGPSYISFESALSFHGWIPEAVPIINSACSKRGKKIETYLGLFVYYNIPISVFHIGVSSFDESITKTSNFFVADPWKAIADLIYLKKRNWKNVIDFSSDLRIEIDVLQHSDLILLEKLSDSYPNSRVRKALKILLKDLIK